MKKDTNKKNSRTQNSIRNMTTSMGGQLLNTLLQFVVRTIFIQTLGKSYLGINGLFSNILTMLSLTELGLDTAINFKLYKPLAEKDEKRVRVLMKFYKDAYRLVAIAVTVLGLCVIPLLPKLIKDYDSLEGLGINATVIFLLYLMQSVSSYMFFASRSAIIKADQKMYKINVAGYFVNLGKSVTEIIVLFLTKNFVLYTFVAIAFTIIGNGIYAYIAKRDYAYAFKKEEEKLSKAEIKDMFKDLGALFVNKINNVVIKSTDNLVLSSVLGLAIVGLYSNYFLFYTTIKTILSKLLSSVKASAGNLFAVESTEKKYNFFEIMNFIAVLIFGIGAVGVAVVADELITVWIGSDYVIPQPFSIILSIEIIFTGLKINLGQIRNVSGAFRQMWFRPIIGIIINLVVSIVMVNFIGINGVLIGTISADILANFMVDPKIIYKVAFENYRPVSEYYVRNIKYLLVLLLIGILDKFICANLLVGFGWISVIVHSVICGISVPVIFLLLFHNKKECQYFINKFSKVLKKKKLKK